MDLLFGLACILVAGVVMTLALVILGTSARRELSLRTAAAATLALSGVGLLVLGIDGAQAGAERWLALLLPLAAALWSAHAWRHRRRRAAARHPLTARRSW